jgi:hypothetical protein
MRRPRMATALLPLLAALAAVVVAGCGGDSSSTTSGDDAAAGMEAFQQCLADQGVELPTPPDGAPTGTPPTGAAPTGAPPAAGDGDSGSGSDGGTPPAASAEQQEAFEACSQYAPGGAPGGGAQFIPPSG